jgi:hypothetical protein
MDAECHLLFAPVRETRFGTLALCTAHLRSGQRVGLAFTSEARLVSAEGLGQHWIRLDERAMHDMLTPIGVDQIRVDPSFDAPPGSTGSGEPGSTPAPSPAREGSRPHWKPRRIPSRMMRTEYRRSPAGWVSRG